MQSQKEGTIYFNIVFHHHQPIGNLPWVIEEVYHKAYLPLLKTIAKYPKITVNLHYSGYLLKWFQKNHPEYLEQVLVLERRNQVEIVGGGFYEPILGFIPERDRKLQIQMLNDWWMDNYNIRTKGIWLAERIWVPNLSVTLHDAGAKFVYLDDYIFKKIGISKSGTFYSHVTEDQGKSIIVLPINQQIRYLIPWKSVLSTIKYLSNHRDSAHKKIIIMMSDAEKMGAWGTGDRTTHEICYIDGHDGKPWMSTLFEEIIRNRWIKPILATDYIEIAEPKGLVYLPAASYDMMSLWSLPVDLRKNFEILNSKTETNEKKSLKGMKPGAIWQNFLMKYSQANVMHKRMIYTRNKIIEAEKKLFNHSSDKFQEIWNLILASQANDSYWHGIFGGIYYVFLRHTVHRHIINADNLLDYLYMQAGYDISHSNILDILFDGSSDGILENKHISCFLSSLNGGSIFSLNLKRKSYNFLNTLTRQLESYHDKTFPVIQDRFEKWLCQDHFISEEIISEDIINDTYQDLGDFANQPYIITRSSSDSLICSRHGKIMLGNSSIKTYLEKKYALKDNILSILYEMSFDDEIPADSIIFSPEMNFIIVSYPYQSYLSWDDELFNLDDHISLHKCKKLCLVDLNPVEQVGIRITFDDSVSCDVFPLYSFPKSGIGYEKLYQGTSIFPKIKVKGKKVRFKVTLFLDEALDDYERIIRNNIIPNKKIIPDP
ncbi:MAG: alpha-amylase/4-alpha-glucanotransferase domain-containing protein [Candidatus Hodarchaeales archaeon]